MRTICKFEISFFDKFTILMPKGAEILCVQIDKKTSNPCLWAIVDTGQINEERVFELFGTGNFLHEDMGIERKYLGTFQDKKGEFVGHLFERLH